MRKRYFFLILAIAITSLSIGFGSSINLYAESNEKEGDILGLIEEGATYYENQKYIFALQKYEEATELLEMAVELDPRPEYKVKLETARKYYGK